MFWSLLSTMLHQVFAKHLGFKWPCSITLILWTVPFWGYGLYTGLLISGGCRYCGTLGFFLYRSWYFYQLSQLHLWWLIWPPLSCSTFFGTQSGDLYTYSSSLWSSSRCCSHLIWLHLLLLLLLLVVVSLMFQGLLSTMLHWVFAKHSIWRSVYLLIFSVVFL